MKELVAFIATALVDDRDAVRVTEVTRDDTTVFELRVARDDLGKVIGKQGRTARAIRSLLATAAARRNRKVRLEILD
jgi:hypothetical protein